MSFRFRAHDTFFLRKGWVNKGLKNVNRDSRVFMGDDVNPIDVLGIGSNMVKALRYWMQVLGLTQEPSSGKKEQTLTEFGELVYSKDPYAEELGTLWMMHYFLATNINDATAWYFFFNEFTYNEFTRDDFVLSIQKFIRASEQAECAESSLEGDYNCIIGTYIPRIKSNPKKVSPESNIDCPLGELGLIDIVNKKSKPWVYKKSRPKIEDVHPLIALAIILNEANGEKEIKISSIQHDACNLGKIMNLDIISLTNILYSIELAGFIKVVRTAGLDIVRIDTDMEMLDCLKEYYKRLQ